MARCAAAKKWASASWTASSRPTKITKLFTFRGLERDEAEEVVAGDIVAIAGVEGIQIGESITSVENPDAAGAADH